MQPDEPEPEPEPEPQVENLRVLPADLAAQWLAPGAGPADPGEVRRRCVDVRGRGITLIAFADGRLFAIDAMCFHLGGPLGAEGAIEDIVLEPGAAPEPVIGCPWHGRRVRLSSGTLLDTHLDGRLLESAGPVQRTYPAYREADGAVHVLWPLRPELVPSDLVNGPTPRTPISSGGTEPAHECSGAARTRRAELMRQRQREHRDQAARVQKGAGTIIAANSATTAERLALRELYAVHNPDKLPHLEALIEKYGGTQLLVAARDKYEPSPSVEPAAGGGGFATPAKQLQPPAKGQHGSRAIGAAAGPGRQRPSTAMRQMCVCHTRMHAAAHLDCANSSCRVLLRVAQWHPPSLRAVRRSLTEAWSSSTEPMEAE